MIGETTKVKTVGGVRATEPRKNKGGGMGDINQGKNGKCHVDDRIEKKGGIAGDTTKAKTVGARGRYNEA